MKSAVASLCFLMCISTHAQAAFTGFEDLAPGSQYSVGSTIQSEGLQFDILPFPSLTGRFTAGLVYYDAVNWSMAIGTGSASLDFVLPQPANRISFDYVVGSNGTGMTINGTATPLSNTLDPLHGTTVGGVSISIDPPMPLVRDGRINLTGSIHSFAIGGVELLIDNVAVFVPEPSTLGLVLLAAGMFSSRRFA